MNNKHKAVRICLHFHSVTSIIKGPTHSKFQSLNASAVMCFDAPSWKLGEKKCIFRPWTLKENSSINCIIYCIFLICNSCIARTPVGMRVTGCRSSNTIPSVVGEVTQSPKKTSHEQNKSPAARWWKPPLRWESVQFSEQMKEVNAVISSSRRPRSPSYRST